MKNLNRLDQAVVNTAQTQSGRRRARLAARAKCDMAAKLLTGLLGSIALMGACGVTDAANAAAPCQLREQPTVGDVFASIGNSSVGFPSVAVFTPTGQPVCTLNDKSGTEITAGSGFDAGSNFYVTNSYVGTVSKFFWAGRGLYQANLSPPSGAFMLSNNTPESITNQYTGAFAGLSLVGGPAPVIEAFNSATGGKPVHSYAITGANGSGGANWVDVYNPATGTVIYTGGGNQILSATCNPGCASLKATPASRTQQKGHFTSVRAEESLQLNAFGLYALRTIPSWNTNYPGYVLAANGAGVVMFDNKGDIYATLLTHQAGGLYSVSLDPDGESAWAGDSASGYVWKFNFTGTPVMGNIVLGITGQIVPGGIERHWSTGSYVGGAGDTDIEGSTLNGLSVLGELLSGGPVPCWAAKPIWC